METFPDEKYDLFGDKSIVLFPLHGHSAGMTGVRVGTKDNYLIIAGDGGYGRLSWEELILPGVEWNRKEAMCSLKRLQKYESVTWIFAQTYPLAMISENA